MRVSLSLGSSFRLSVFVVWFTGGESHFAIDLKKVNLLNPDPTLQKQTLVVSLQKLNPDLSLTNRLLHHLSLDAHVF